MSARNYTSPAHRALLAASGLADFAALWNLKAAWFEEPNFRRGGWSGVCRLELPLPDGEAKAAFFLKRQENHRRRTWRHPLSGEPSFACEFRNLIHLHKHGLAAPKPAFFACRRQGRALQSILLTEELTGFLPLDNFLDDFFAAQDRPALAQQRAVLRAVATAVRGLHAAGVQHNALYPKHIFIRWHGDSPEVAFIDLEKARCGIFAARRTLHDLEALNRRSAHWSRSARLYFFLAYLQQARLDPAARRLCRQILSCNQKKRLQK